MQSASLYSSSINTKKNVKFQSDSKNETNPGFMLLFQNHSEKHSTSITKAPQKKCLKDLVRDASKNETKTGKC